MAKASKVVVNLQKDTDRTVYATWTWSKSNTDHYKVIWYYATGNGVWFIGTDTTVTAKQSVYTAPSNATKVRFKVKPIAKTHKVNKKSVAYWTASYSTNVDYVFAVPKTPEKPSAPSVSIDKFKLTVEIDTYDTNTQKIEFQVVKNNSTVVSAGKSSVKTKHAAYSCNIDAGGEYKVRCRGIRTYQTTTQVKYLIKKATKKTKAVYGYRTEKKDMEETGPWSEYSSNVGTIPSTPSKITKCEVQSLTSVKLTWNRVNNADSYDIEYTTQKAYFDSSNEVQSMSVNAVVNTAIVTGIDPGSTWFFRVRAVNSKGESGWCSPVSIVLGKKPSPPTTWSETSTAIVGNDVHLYWVHNSEDGSSQTYAQIELTAGGRTQIVTVQNTASEDERDKTSSYTFATSAYAEGTVLTWRVRTRGVLNEYSDWSMQRQVTIYAPPTLEFGVSGVNNWYWDTFNFNEDTIYSARGSSGALLDVLTSFPFYISATAKPDTQSAISYSVVIYANEAYETTDNIGRDIYIGEGEQVYSKQIDATNNQLFCVLSAGDLNLENNISYTIYCTVAMNSGLTAEASAEFTVEWEDDEFEPDAEIGIDEQTLSAYIRPYCEDEDGNLFSNVMLSVYRREYDGRFVELSSDLDNTRAITVTDPHPALDYARYRVVAMSRVTGNISFYDLPGYPIDEPAIVIQWDEDWSEFNVEEGEEDEIAEPVWSGSMLKLPYNVDVSDKYAPDVAFVNYIGRQHPVTYYGTQLGETATWSTEIPAEDKDTLYALRRLAIFAGDVYVREPSGSGYWAQVNVSFNQKHMALTIPVSLDIKRVDGGI